MNYFQNIPRPFLPFIFLSSLFFLINSENLTPNNSYLFKIEQKTQYILTIPKDNSKYVELIVKGNKLSTNFVVSIYPDSNMDKRIQLGQTISGETKLYLSLNQITGENIYMDIECSDYTCNGEISNKFTTIINLEENKPFSYYVNEKNTEMEFSLKLQSSISNVWARGQYDIETQLKASNKIKSNKGNFYIINGSENSVIMNVKGTPGDYINVGYVTYNSNLDSNSELQIDSAPITAFLKKGTLNNICYNIQSINNNSNEPVTGTGIIFTKIAYFYSSETREENGEVFSSGIIKNIINNVNENSKVCFKFPDSNIYPQFSEIDEIIFTYRINKVTIDNNYILNEPQLNGIFYPNVIKLGSKAVFISQKDGDFSIMSLNLMQVEGFPKMYVIECDNYPLCSFDDDILKNGIRPRNINRFSSYRKNKTNEYDDSPISRKQTLFVVECEKTETVSGDNPICSFNTLIYKEKGDIIDTIQLFEEHFFNQFAVNEQQHNYKIKISNETKIKKVFIDIMTYVGDVEVATNFPRNVQADTYIAINKIFISAKILENSVEDLNFIVTAKNNTYYTILVNFGREEIEEDSFITNKLQTGMSYLVTIDPEKKDSYSLGNKIVKFKNEKIMDKLPFMVTFYSLNCELEISQIINEENNSDKEISLKPIENYVNFAYDTLDTTSNIYNSPSYDYLIKAIERDTSYYERNLCKLYASAIELSFNHDQYMRDILIPDNTPQQVRFGTNIKHVSYGYIHVDHYNNDLLIKFNPKNIAEYSVTLYYEYEEREKGAFSIVANDMFYIENSEWKKRCRDPNRVCYIQIDILLKRIKDDADSAALEFSIKSMASHSVDYIPKNNLKIDYVQNNIPQYYYTEIGTREKGFIIANFLRGSGKILAKKVEINLEKGENEANWRGKYKLPSNDDTNILSMNPFTKKITFSTENNCKSGCFLIISVFSDVKADNKHTFKRNYPFSIIVHSYPNELSNENIPIINIPIDEYVVGSIEPSEQINKIYEFYSVRLNKEASQIIFDFQSDAAGLFVNIGKNRTTSIDKAEFKFFPMGKDSIHRINKWEITNLNNNIKSLKDIILTIGIWTNVTDSIDTTPYSFAVRLEGGTHEDIFRVNSDQKVLCDSQLYDKNKFRCVYVMEYDYIHDYSGLFIYANIQDKSVFYNIYAKYIDSKTYEIDTSKTKGLIPNENDCDLSTKKQNTDFLYIQEGFTNEDYILVTVETNKQATIELLSTIFLFPEEITPNPSSPQLFMDRHDYSFSLNFPEDYSVMVNLICIGGSAELYWDFAPEKKYYLKGRDDRLSITSDKAGKIQKLLIKGTSEIIDKTGFVFYVNYNIRKNEHNFDELNLGKSTNYAYSNTDFPISFYTQINKDIDEQRNGYYDIFFTFDNLESEINKTLTYFDNYPFTYIALIVNQSDIYKQKKNQYSILVSYNLDKITGYYDQALRTALVRIEQKDINKANIPENEKPYLFLKIDKADGFKSIRKYKRIGVESTVLKSKSEIPISELSNQFGYLNKEEYSKDYILRIDNTKKYMNLEFSCEDNGLVIKIDKIVNILQEEKTIYGKTFYSLLTNGLEDSVILTIKRNDEKLESDVKVEFFMFRYTFSDQSYNNKYTIKNTKIEVNQKETSKGLYDYIIKLTPLNDYTKYNLTYILRGNYEGNKPKDADLSMKVNSQKVKEFYDPQPKGNTLSLDMYDIIFNFSYIQVILQIKNKENIEYLSYDLQDNFKFTKYNTNNEDDDDNNKRILIAFVIVVPLIIVSIIILIIVLFTCRNKNKDLIDQVNKISFAEDKPSINDDKLLIFNDEDD